MTAPPRSTRWRTFAASAVSAGIAVVEHHEADRRRRIRQAAMHGRISEAEEVRRLLRSFRAEVWWLLSLTRIGRLCGVVSPANLSRLAATRAHALEELKRRG